MNKGGFTLILFVIILLIIILFIFITAIYLSKIVLFPKTREYGETYELQKKLGAINGNFIKTLANKEFYLQSNYGYKLHTIFFPNNNSNKTVILCHGITDSLFCSMKYMNIFIKRGFNVVIYDHRFHGKSGGPNCSYGYFEKFDLKTVADWVFKNCGQDSIVGILGESMGAATILQNSRIDKRISFYIADCPYSDVNELFKLRIRADYHLPAFPLIPIASFINKLTTNVFYNQISPIKDIVSVETPIFFIHGENDNYIPHKMSIDLYNAKKHGVRKLYIAPNADHVESYLKNIEEYDRLVGEFLKSIHVI